MDWAAELAEADLLLESRGTTELTIGLLKDHHSGEHLISYHEGLHQDTVPTAGVLALDSTNADKKAKDSNDDKEDILRVMQMKIEHRNSQNDRNPQNAKRWRSQHEDNTKKTKREIQKGGPIANTWR